MKTGTRQLSIVAILVILIAIFLGTCCSSCKIFRNVDKQSLKTDTSNVSVHTSEATISIDSSKFKSSLTNIDFTDSSVIRTTDEYDKVRTDFYKPDSTGKPQLFKSETKVKGKKTTTKNINKKQTTNISDTNINKGIYQASQKTKDSNAAQGSSEANSKKTGAGAKTTFGGTLLIVGGVVALILILLAVYRRYRSKLKQVTP